MKKIKFTYRKLLRLEAVLLAYKNKSTAIGWAISRSYVFVSKQTELYYEQLQELIKLHAEKDDKGNPKMVEKGTGADISDYIFKDRAAFDKELEEFQKSEVEVDIYEAPMPKVLQYLDTNPPPMEYEHLVGNIINPTDI